MPYDAGLAQRIREIVAGRPGLSERKMFGGLAFMLDGNMFAGVVGTSLMARVGPARYEEALAARHARLMDFTGRPMRGYVFVDGEGLAEDEDLRRWLSWCILHAATLPAKTEGS